MPPSSIAPRLGEGRADLAVGIERRERLEQLSRDLAALPASPWAAGSRVVGAPVRMRAIRVESAAGPEQAANDNDTVSSHAIRPQRRIAGSIRAVLEFGPRAPKSGVGPRMAP